jgi:ATP-dependent Clp protease ATP-binding subunit ClpA
MLTFTELQNKSRIHYPAVLLDEFISFSSRRILKKVSLILTIILFFIMIISPYADGIFLGSLLPASIEDFLLSNIYRTRGLFVIFFIIWLKSYLINGFYVSYYFKRGKVDFEVSRLVYGADPEDVTESFLYSRIGEYTIDKLGITEQELKHFLKDEDRNKIRDRDLRFYYNARKKTTDDDRTVNLVDYVKAIFDADRDLRDFLTAQNVNEEEFFGALEWVQNIAWKIRRKTKFWSRENLVKVPSLGRNWSIEKSDILNKYTHLIYENQTYKSLGKDWKIFEDEAERLEDLILDQKLNNVLLVSDDVGTGLQTVSVFGKMIVDGKSLPKFEDKKIHVLNVENILVHKNNKEKFEAEVKDLMEETSRMGNVILTIPDLGEFIESAMEIGVDVVNVLKTVINTTKTPLIAVVTKSDYYSLVEPDFDLVKYFDKFTIPSIDDKFVLRILQNEAHKIENIDGKNITYPVLEKISKKHLTSEEPVKESLKELYRIYE